MTEPTYSLSIPSIHDQTPLDCRIYHPESSILRHRDTAPRASLKAAIIAHPYAPLGGSFDDAVVLSVTDTLLLEGFIVGTFNFRGAGDSAGSTSMTGKAEQADYESFIGFLVTYCRSLLPHMPVGSRETDIVDDQSSMASLSDRTEIALLLAGYSYGSLVLARLRTLACILEHFQEPAAAGAHADIVARARNLSVETKKQSLDPSNVSASRVSEERRHRIAGNDKSSVTVGHGRPGFHTRGHGIHLKKGHIESHRGEAPQAHLTASMSDISTDPNVHAAYLFISPVILPFTHSLCPPGSPSIMLSLGRATAASSHSAPFRSHPTLTVFGGKDGFSSNQRLRGWATKEHEESQSSFEWTEIEEAGHFWREEGVMQALQERIVPWCRPNRNGHGSHCS